jgi:hypothetical protein
MTLIIVLTILLSLGPRHHVRQVQKQRTPKPFTQAWYEHQCRELGAICPQKPLCQLDRDVDNRPPVNRICK